jgi:hypothetical protein
MPPPPDGVGTFKTPAASVAAPLPAVVRDWKGKSVVFVTATDDVIVEAEPATPNWVAVIPERPLLPLGVPYPVPSALA